MQATVTIVVTAVAAFAVVICLLSVVALLGPVRPRRRADDDGFRGAGDVGPGLRLGLVQADVEALEEESDRLRWLALDGLPAASRSPGELRALGRELGSVGAEVRALRTDVDHAATIWADTVLRHLEQPSIPDRLPRLERELRALTARVRAADERLGPVGSEPRPAR